MYLLSEQLSEGPSKGGGERQARDGRRWAVWLIT